MVKFYKHKAFLPVLSSVILSFAFVALAAYATTTISTDITTGGNLTVTGNYALIGTTTPATLSVLTVEATSSATAIPLTIRGYNSQSANLFQIQNVASSNLFAIDSTGAVTTGIWKGTAIAYNYGGTGLTTFTGGGRLLYSSNATTLTTLASSTDGYFLQIQAGTGYPGWSQTLGGANGGTGLTSAAAGNVLIGANDNTNLVATSSVSVSPDGALRLHTNPANQPAQVAGLAAFCLEFYATSTATLDHMFAIASTTATTTGGTNGLGYIVYALGGCN